MTDLSQKDAEKAVAAAEGELMMAKVFAAQAALAAAEAQDAVEIQERRLHAARTILAILNGESPPIPTVGYHPPEIKGTYRPPTVVGTPAVDTATAPAGAPTPAGPSVFEQAQAAAAAGDPLAARSTGGREDPDAPPPSNRYNGPPCPACGTPGGMRATLITTKGGQLPGMSCYKCGHQKVFS